MRVSAHGASISWIPSDVVTGPMRAGFDVGLAHYDPPPPERVAVDDLHLMCADDRYRFANLLSGWADIDDGRVVDAGYEGESGLLIGSTTARLGPVRVTVRAGRLPTRRRAPESLPDGGVRLVQTVGGRTGFPMPRPVSRPPYVQWSAPVVWTTLALTIRPEGDHEVELVGASAFPRHWLFDAAGALVAKSGLADPAHWMDSSFGERTPWGDHDSPAIVAEAVGDLERQLSDDIMHGERPRIERLAATEPLMRQGEPGRELYLVLDGVLEVVVDGRPVGQAGPGAVLGERALLEGGVRTATVTALTPVTVAVAPAEDIDLTRLAELARGHRREDEPDTQP